MKKLIAVFILLLSVALLFLFSSGLFAEPKTLNLYSEIPFELRGTWYSLWFSEDQGKTEDTKYQPLFAVDSDTIATVHYVDYIISAEKFQFKEGIGYALYSEDNITTYLVMFYPDTEDLPVVYIFKNKIEQCRSCIKIVKI